MSRTTRQEALTYDRLNDEDLKGKRIFTRVLSFENIVIVHTLPSASSELSRKWHGLGSLNMRSCRMLVSISRSTSKGAYGITEEIQ